MHFLFKAQAISMDRVGHFKQKKVDKKFIMIKMFASLVLEKNCLLHNSIGDQSVQRSWPPSQTLSPSHIKSFNTPHPSTLRLIPLSSLFYLKKAYIEERKKVSSNQSIRESKKNHVQNRSNARFWAAAIFFPNIFSQFQAKRKL